MGRTGINEGDNELAKLEIRDGAINFACLKEKCPTPCCGPFGGVKQGIESVDGRGFAEIVLTGMDVNLMVENGASDLMEQGDCGKVRMRLEEDGTCVAFKNGRCSIHEFKPTVCRAFPFYIDMFVGLCGVTACPGFGEGWTPLEDLDQEISAAGGMYEYWLSELRKAELHGDDAFNQEL